MIIQVQRRATRSAAVLIIGLELVTSTLLESLSAHLEKVFFHGGSRQRLGRKVAGEVNMIGPITYCI
jgi:hypothetical protein